MDSDEAFRLEALVLAARMVERQSWVVLAEQLATFHEGEAWRLLGHEKFTDWLGTPEVSLSRRSAYRLIQAWRFGRSYGIPAELLMTVDLTKLMVVIPSVEAGLAEPQAAVSDAAMLSRSDLVEKYGGSRGGVSESTEATSKVAQVDTICPSCGSEITVEVAV